MGIGEIIVIAIVAIVLYSVFSMRKKPADQGSPSDNGRQDKGNPGNDTAGSQPGPPRRKAGYAKWVGGGLGWVFGGPIGAILGVALGSVFDGMNTGTVSYQGTQRGDFAMSLLVLSAAVMKADQKIVKSELEFVRSFFVNQFGNDEGNRLISMLREILKQEIDVQQVSIQVGQYTDYAVKLQLVHYLFGIAAADGQYHPDEVAMIASISGYMGIPQSEFASIKAMFVKNLNWAYDVLEITTSATDEEVKKAYREMAKKHHPDKVSHLGEDVKQSATLKFQEVSAAYEEIKKQRGLN
ncbi:MAG: TerB family tellurite resistance protein [Bacteroidota bacterium]